MSGLRHRGDDVRRRGRRVATLQRLQAICAWQGLEVRGVLTRIHIAETVRHFGSERDMGVVRRQFYHHPEVSFTVVDPLYLAAAADSRQLFDWPNTSQLSSRSS